MQWSRLEFDSCCGRGVREKFQPHHLWECEAKHGCAEISAWISLGERKAVASFFVQFRNYFPTDCFCRLAPPLRSPWSCQRPDLSIGQQWRRQLRLPRANLWRPSTKLWCPRAILWRSTAILWLQSTASIHLFRRLWKEEAFQCPLVDHQLGGILTLLRPPMQ